MRYRLEVSKPDTHPDFHCTHRIDDHIEPGADTVTAVMVDALVDGLNEAGFTTHLYRTSEVEELVR